MTRALQLTLDREPECSRATDSQQDAKPSRLSLIENAAQLF